MKPAKFYMTELMATLEDIHKAFRAIDDPTQVPAVPRNMLWIMKLPPGPFAEFGTDLAELKASLEEARDYVHENPALFFKNALEHLESILAIHSLMAVIF